MSEVKYFKIDNFQEELSVYLNQCSAWYVTAMCPVCNFNGRTTGIYVTLTRGD